MQQITNGHEIEARFLLAYGDHLYDPKALSTAQGIFKGAGKFIRIYDQVLREGMIIEQGYIMKDKKAWIAKLGITLHESFKVDTLRLRKIRSNLGSPCQRIITIKTDKVDGKRQELEYKLSPRERVYAFEKAWSNTLGHRVFKKRLKLKLEGRVFEVDAFLDRYLLIAECEVKNVEALKRVPIIGKDITDDKTLTNKKLAK